MAAPLDFSRRAFLQNLGASAALAPFLPILNASGAEVLAPKRLILFWTPHGTYIPAWSPRGSVDNFTLGPSLAALNPLRSKVNIIQGVGMKGGLHQQAMQLWTGTQLINPNGEPDDSCIPRNSSIDQTIAAALGGLTKYPVLNFGIAGGYGGVLSNTIVNNGVAVQSMLDPRSTFNKIFASDTPATQNARNHVLDAVTARISALKSRLPATDRFKLEAHLSGIESLQTQINKQSASCSGPNFTGDPGTDGSDASLEPYSEVMIQMAVAALQCDLTRVVTIQVAVDGNDGHTYPFVGVNFGHHFLTHTPPSDILDPNGNPTSDQTLSVNGQLTRIYTWYAKQFASLLAQLDAVPEGSGTMLDNTLVVWGTELAHCYTHGSGPSLPLVTGGSLGGSFKTGRWLDYSANPQDHNRLLVSICNAMGLPSVNTYGLTDVGSGPLVNF